MQMHKNTEKAKTSDYLTSILIYGV